MSCSRKRYCSHMLRFILPIGYMCMDRQWISCCFELLVLNSDFMTDARRCRSLKQLWVTTVFHGIRRIHDFTWVAMIRHESSWHNSRVENHPLHYLTDTDILILGVLMISRWLPWRPTVVFVVASGQFLGTHGHSRALSVNDEHPGLFTSGYGS